MEVILTELGTAAVGEVAKSTVQPVLGALAARAGKYITPSDAQAVQKHLCEALEDPLVRPSVWHQIKRRKVKKAIKTVAKEIKTETPTTMLYAEITAGPVGPQATWRNDVRDVLYAIAVGATASEDSAPSWQQVLGGLSPDVWAGAVTFAFEKRLRADKDLRYLVQTLDYRHEQAGEAVLALAVQDMAASLRRIAWAIVSVATLVTGSAEIVPHFWH